MPTTNETILDRYIRHQTYMLRYAGGLRNRSIPQLIKTEKDLYSTIIEWIARTENNRTLTGTSGRKWQKDFEKVLNQVRFPAWNEVNDFIRDDLKRFAVSEAAVGKAIIEGSTPVILGMQLPPTEKLIGIVNSQPFEGRTLKEWLDVTAVRDVQRIMRYAKTGIVQGRTPTQIAREVIGTSASGYRDSITRKAFNDLESTLLTLTNGIQNEAKQALYEANSDIIKDELYVATLDVRTTIQCAGLDGQTFKLGEGPIPPIHFRCRSLRVPYLNPELLGNRGFDSNVEKDVLKAYTDANGLEPVDSREDLPRGYKTKYDKFARREKNNRIGQVPAQTTYNKWLKTQTKSFQDEVLGPTRAKLFRNGTLTLDKFVSPSGELFSLNELVKREGITLD